MAITLATSSAKAMAMEVAVCRATWVGKKPTRVKVMATLMAKNVCKYMAGGSKHGRQIQCQNLGCGQKPLATLVATKEQTSIAGKSKSNQASKSYGQIVARAKDRMREWEITWKSRPRRHIAWPHDIVCGHWFAQAPSELVLYVKQVTIFNQMVVV